MKVPPCEFMAKMRPRGIDDTEGFAYPPDRPLTLHVVLSKERVHPRRVRQSDTVDAPGSSREHERRPRQRPHQRHSNINDNTNNSGRAQVHVRRTSKA